MTLMCTFWCVFLLTKALGQHVECLQREICDEGCSFRSKFCDYESLDLNIEDRTKWQSSGFTTALLNNFQGYISSLKLHIEATSTNVRIFVLKIQ